MRTFFMTADALARGVTPAQLRWGERTGRWRRVDRGVYALGPEPPTRLDRAVATVLGTGGVACGTLAGVLHGLDGVRLGPPPHVTLARSRQTRRGTARHLDLPPERITSAFGIPCTDGFRTLVDLAALVDDLIWEQAAESAVRRKLTSIANLEETLPALGRSRTPGTRRIRRVLASRPPGAPPTESLLETLMVQIARTVAGLGDPVRQLEVYDAHGRLVARVDLAWPDLGLFVELDGEHHKGQPVYDASRETALVAVTGWLCARFSWSEAYRVPTATARRLAQVAEQCRRRPPTPSFRTALRAARCPEIGGSTTQSAVRKTPVSGSPS